MYTRNVLQSVVFVIVVFCSRFVHCDVSRKNCSSYQQVFKENLRNCVVETDAGHTGHHNQSTHDESSPDGGTQKWEIELTNKTGLSIQKNLSDITLQITRISTSVEARKKRMKVMDIIPYLIIPGFISAGVLPWLIPGLKIAVMGVAMINQMAFTSSLFSLIRGYIFDTSQEDHIVYVNHGYEKYKHQKYSHHR